MAQHAIGSNGLAASSSPRLWAGLLASVTTVVGTYLVAGMCPIHEIRLMAFTLGSAIALVAWLTRERRKVRTSPIARFEWAGRDDEHEDSFGDSEQMSRCDLPRAPSDPLGEL
jgi:hypothetical protein